MSLRPLLMMKNVFYFMLNAHFVLTIFKFLSLYFGYVERRLDKKATVSLKSSDSFKTVWTSKVPVDNTINSYNTRNKDNETMKFGELLKCNVINIFLRKSEKMAGRLVPDLFLFFKKALYKTKASGQHLSFNIFW